MRIFALAALAVLAPGVCLAQTPPPVGVPPPVNLEVGTGSDRPSSRAPHHKDAQERAEKALIEDDTTGHATWRAVRNAAEIYLKSTPPERPRSH